ncbi:MAG: Flp family type IVb pilin [Planctomycetota bacterium]
MARDHWRRFRRDEQGLETVEYAIIIGLLVVGVIGAIAGIGAWVTSKYEAVNSDLNSQTAPAPASSSSSFGPLTRRG